jgi:peptidoglycan/LPS O-acetylase OafA/YrhL
MPDTSWDTRLAKGSGNAFDLIRIMLAAMVVLEHSYFLIDNSTRRDPLFILSGGQTNFGQFAVYMFFALSGFLVTRSLLEGRGVGEYLGRRVGRIFPGFLVASMFGCLIVGPLSASHLGAYFKAQNWLLMGLNALTLQPENVIGALAGNRLTMVHGTLWTIQYEFDCYLILAGLGVLGLLQPRLAGWTYIGLAIGLMLAKLFQARLPVIDHGVLAFLLSSPTQWPNLFPFFLAGSAFYVYRNRIPKSRIGLVAALVIVALTLAFGEVYWAMLFCGTYALLFLALSCTGVLTVMGHRVDLSYGVYLYGWPMQQLLLFYTHMGLSPLALFALAMVLALMVAWVSWTLIERPALKLAHSHEQFWRERRQALAVST